MIVCQGLIRNYSVVSEFIALLLFLFVSELRECLVIRMVMVLFSVGKMITASR